MMTQMLKNSEISSRILQLKPFLNRKDKIGYAAARNTRVLSNQLIEYNTIRNELIQKYGEPDLDENGMDIGTVSIKISSPKFLDFCKELEPFNNIEHEVEFMVLKYEEVIGILTGEEILTIDWMLSD